MTHLQGGIAVITGAASGFGLETCRIAAGLNVQADALATAQKEIEGLGAQVLPFKLDVSKAAEVEALAAATLQRFGTPSFVFNNAGVGAGGLIWEHTLKDWEWVIGVNLMGVAHGLRVFTPLMLAVKVAFGGRGTCGTKVRTRLLTPSEVVPATGPDGPVRVITAPGWTGSSKDSRTTVVTSTCSDPVSGVELSRPGARWSRVLKVALNKAGKVRPTRSRGPRLVTWPVALNNSPSTTMS